MYRRDRRPLPISLSLIQDHERTLHSLPEYIESIDAMRSDEVISSQVDKSVGTPFSRYFLSAEGVVDRILFGTFRRQGGYKKPTGAGSRRPANKIFRGRTENDAGGKDCLAIKIYR